MLYKVTVSEEWEVRDIYFTDKDEAELVYRMAVHSKMFVYVELSEAKVKYFPAKIWSEDDDE